MDKIRLVLIEDNDEELQVCADSVKKYERQFQRSVEVVACKSVAEAKNRVDNSFDGAIVDLKLDAQGDEGGQVIEFIQKNLRIPVVIFTGTPQNADGDSGRIRIYKKGETSYEELFNLFFEIYYTGVTRILGGRGVIEQAMNAVFWNSVVPVLDAWRKYVIHGKETETAMLRFVVSHLLELLEEPDACFPEEMYLFPFDGARIKTGQIVKKRGSEECFVILSPACDLVIHNDQMKTDRILLCTIETRPSLVKSARQMLGRILSETASEEEKENLKQRQLKANDTLSRLVCNNYSNYYHYLPKTMRFSGGFINFRKIITCTKGEFTQLYEPSIVQVAMAFTKDIVARFSSYYARQGQPDFDFKSLLEEIKNQE